MYYKPKLHRLLQYLFFDQPSKFVQKQQMVQNASAKELSKTKKKTHLPCPQWSPLPTSIV